MFLLIFCFEQKKNLLFRVFILSFAAKNTFFLTSPPNHPSISRQPLVAPTVSIT
jgi:hypothetical protein